MPLPLRPLLSCRALRRLCRATVRAPATAGSLGAPLSPHTPHHHPARAACARLTQGRAPLIPSFPCRCSLAARPWGPLPSAGRGGVCPMPRGHPSAAGAREHRLDRGAAHVCVGARPPPRQARRAGEAHAGISRPRRRAPPALPPPAAPSACTLPSGPPFMLASRAATAQTQRPTRFLSSSGRVFGIFDQGKGLHVHCMMENPLEMERTDADRRHDQHGRDPEPGRV